MTRLLLPAAFVLLSTLATAAFADGVRGHTLGADMARRLAPAEPEAPEAEEPGAEAGTDVACSAATATCPASPVAAGE
jgi:hypothetical protein